LGHDQDGIDVAWMVGQNEDGPAQFPQAVQALDLDAIAEPEQRTAHVAREELNDHGRGVPCQTKAHRLKLKGKIFTE
jgi:hypothetical protein